MSSNERSFSTPSCNLAEEPALAPPAQTRAYYSISVRINHAIPMHTAPKLRTISLFLSPFIEKVSMFQRINMELFLPALSGKKCLHRSRECKTGIPPKI